MTTRQDSHRAADDQQRSVRQALRARAKEAVVRQPNRTVTMLSSLLAVHDEIGYLPPEAVDEVAQRTGSSLNEVWGVASFYPNFRFTPPARHRVELCWGPTCHVLGAQPILQGLLRHLGLENEGDTADGGVTLKLNTCLGVCPHGPAMSFDHELFGHMSLDRAVRQVALLRVEDEEQLLTRRLEEEAEEARAERAANAAARAERQQEAVARATARAEEQAKLVAAEAPAASAEATEESGDVTGAVGEAEASASPPAEAGNEENESPENDGTQESGSGQKND